MKIAILGATGVLGRNFCKLAQRTKHEITAIVRDSHAAEDLREHGARVVTSSIFADSLRQVLSDHDVVLNFVSAIPKKAKTSAKDWESNDRLRIEGTRNLLNSLPANAFYCQAGLTFIYGDHKGKWVNEESALNVNAYTASARTMEEMFLSHDGNLRGVSFRFSAFYHQDAWHTRYLIDELRKRRLPIVGDGNYFWNFIHAADAASAVLWILDHQESIHGREIMNVSDDEPVLSKDFLYHLAHLIGVSEPVRIPQLIARLTLGTEGVEVLTASHRCSTERIKQTGWNPSYRSFREGFTTVLQFL